MVGSDCGDWFACIPHVVASEDWLVARDQPVGELAWHIVGGYDR
jgi:hypothetical protein